MFVIEINILNHHRALLLINIIHILGNIRQPVNQLDIELKIAKILVGLIGAWMVTWTPYAIVALIGISGHGHLLTVIL